MHSRKRPIPERRLRYVLGPDEERFGRHWVFNNTTLVAFHVTDDLWFGVEQIHQSPRGPEWECNDWVRHTEGKPDDYDAAGLKALLRAKFGEYYHG
jgi:hypothetical protein